MFLFWSVIIGPSLMRQDFRQDLPNMEILKTFPMRGWQVVLGQLLAPAAILGAAQWVLILLGVVVCTQFPGIREVPLPTRIVCGIAAVAIFPVFNLLCLKIGRAHV